MDSDSGISTIPRNSTGKKKAIFETGTQTSFDQNKKKPSNQTQTLFDQNKKKPSNQQQESQESQESNDPNDDAFVDDDEDDESEVELKSLGRRKPFARLDTFDIFEKAQQKKSATLDRRRIESDDESRIKFLNPSGSDRSSPESYSHRKSVSFDLSGDERSKSDYERSYSPDTINRHFYYDSEEYISSLDSRKGRDRGLKGILRSTSPSATLERPRCMIANRISESEFEDYSVPEENVTRITSDDEIERENPFREAFLSNEKFDLDEEIRKISVQDRKGSRDHFVIGKQIPVHALSKSNEDLLNPVMIPIRKTVHMSTGNLSDPVKKKPPPPLPPKPKIKLANVVRNTALTQLQNEQEHGDFVQYEHNVETNTIREVPAERPTSYFSPDAPLPPVPGIITSKKLNTRPMDSPPPPPINLATLPIPAKYHTLPTPKRAEFIHENSPDNILVTEDVYRNVLLHENEIRNMIKENPDAIHKNPVNSSILSSPIPDLSQSSNPTTPNISMQSEQQQFHGIQQQLQQHQQQTTYGLPLSPTHIFPPPQILPVQYTNLPLPQQPGGYYHITQHQQQNLAQQNYLQLGYSTMGYTIPTQTIPGLSTFMSPPPSAKTPKTVSDKKKFFETAMEEQQKPSPKPEKVFSFLSKDEVEKLKQEEERKIATLQHDKKQRLLEGGDGYGEVSEDDDDDDDDDDDEDDEDDDDEEDESDENSENGNGDSRHVSMIPTMVQREIPKPQISIRSNRFSPPSKSPALAMFATNSPSRIPVRTANSEKRELSARSNSQSPIDSNLTYTERALSPLEVEALKAEKRAAWRQARLKSLEQDAIQAQAMIQSMNQMADGLIDDNKNEVETCQEKIISLELQDPEKEVPVLIASDEDTASIVTIRPNPDKLFLRRDDDSDQMTDNSRLHQLNSRTGLNSVELSGQDEEDGQILTSVSSVSSNNEYVVPLQTIVEVVNPIIAGDGCPNRIAIGRSTDCAYPSFDDYSGYSYSSHEDIEDDDGIEGGSYRGRELSLNDKMKNVLQELLENERVKLNLSRSLIEDDSTDPEDPDDEDEDETDILRDEDDTDSIQCRNQMKSNGNFHIDSIKTDSNENFKGSQTKDDDADVDDGTGRLDYDFKSFVDGCRVYKNPNTEISFDDTTGNTTTITTTTTIVKDNSELPVATNDNRTLKEKLMSQLEVNDKADSCGALKPQSLQVVVHHKDKFGDNNKCPREQVAAAGAADDDEDDDEDVDDEQNLKDDEQQQPTHQDDDDDWDDTTITKTIITTETCDSTRTGDEPTTTTTVTTTTTTEHGQAVKTATTNNQSTTKKKKRKPKNKKK